jgi:hypothetical protein
MSAAFLSITLEQGYPWSRTFCFKNSDGTALNLAGYSARHEFKYKYGGSALFTLTPGSGIVISEALGRVTVTVSAAQVLLLTHCAGVHNLVLVDPSAVPRREVTGPVIVEPT